MKNHEKGGIVMARRDNGDGKEDLRQRRSKQRLSDALLSLLEEKPFRTISVVDICDRAMVHRTTFYAHFEDKLGLLRYVLDQTKDRLREINKRVTGEKGFQAALMEEFRLCLGFLKEHKSLLLDGLDGSDMGLRVVEDTVADALKERNEEEGLWSGEPQGAELAGHFYAGAILSLMRWWLENNMPIPEEELVERLQGLMPPQVARARA